MWLWCLNFFFAELFFHKFKFKKIKFSLMMIVRGFASATWENVPKVSFAIDDKFWTRCHIKLSCFVINCILFKSWKIVLWVNLKNILIIMHILYHTHPHTHTIHLVKFCSQIERRLHSLICMYVYTKRYTLLSNNNRIYAAWSDMKYVL